MWFSKIEQVCSNSNKPYMWFYKIEQACTNSNEPYMWFCKIEQACTNSNEPLYVVQQNRTGLFYFKIRGLC